MLEIKNLNVHYGVIHALKDISLAVNEGEIVTLIGANGAGKTTTLRTISGINKATSGEILLEGKEITNISAPQRVGMKISQVPEGRRIFSDMSVLENLELGAFLRKDKKEIKKDLEHIYELFPILCYRKKQNAKMALSIANRAYVIETGKIIMSGTGEELSRSDEIQKAYLGG